MQSRLRAWHSRGGHGRVAPCRHRTVCCRAVNTRVVNQHAEILDAYWRARGVFAPEQRQKLLEMGLSSAEGPGDGPEQDASVAESTTQASSSGDMHWTGTGLLQTQEVVEISQRLWTLYQLLGGGQEDLLPSDNKHEPVSAADLAFMVIRQPQLLSTDPGQLVRRLLEMRVATAGTGVDVVSIAVRQPSLLTSDSWSLDLRSLSGSGASTSGQAGGAGVEQLVRAWEHGVTGDGDQDWNNRFEQLQAYVQRHGDASVGYRDGDAAEGLDRWAAKQRSDHKAGLLSEDRQHQLASIGFQFDDDEAEWIRWHTELSNFRKANGHCSPWAMSQGVDLRLINWASVQRIARRSKVLSDARIARLDSLDFDWTGADPLS